MTKHGKKYTAAAAKVDIDKVYSAREAVALAKETSITKFDATVEVHMRTTLDSRQADQQLRDVVVLPHGLGIRGRHLETPGRFGTPLGDGLGFLEAAHKFFKQRLVHVQSSLTSSRKMAVSLSLRSSFLDFG